MNQPDTDKPNDCMERALETIGNITNHEDLKPLLGNLPRVWPTTTRDGYNVDWAICPHCKTGSRHP